MLGILTPPPDLAPGHPQFPIPEHSSMREWEWNQKGALHQNWETGKKELITASYFSESTCKSARCSNVMQDQFS